MKKNFIFVFLVIWLDLFSQNNFNFERTIDNCINYQKSAVQIKDNKIFLSSSSSLETFNYDDNGNISFDNSIARYRSTGLSIISGDTLIEANYTTQPNSLHFDTYNIASGTPVPINSINMDIHLNQVPMTLKKNNEYLFYVPGGSTYSFAFDINTLTFVDSIYKGFKYELKDQYIFSETNVQENNFDISISDISDIHNPILLSSVHVEMYYWTYDIKIIGDKLFLLGNDKVTIIDVSDVFNPFIISTIENIPSYSEYSAKISLLVKDNYLLLYDDYGAIWIYDISDINNPVFCNMITDYNALGFFSNIFPYMAIDYSANLLFFPASSVRLSSFDISNLPEISLIDSKGKEDGEFMPFIQLFNGNLFYERFTLNSSVLYYLNYEEQTDNSTALTNYGTILSYPSTNDTVFCYEKFNPIQELVSLSFNKMRDGNIEEYNQIALGEETYYYFSILGENLLRINGNIINVYSIRDNNFSEQIGTIDVGTSDFKLAYKNNNVTTDYIFITYPSTYQKRLRIYQNTPPFEQIADFQVGFSEDNIFILNDHLILRQFADGSKKLYTYNFPDELQETDTLDDSCYIHFFSYSTINDFVIYEKERDICHYKFIPIIDSNHFGESFIYDFGFEVKSIFFYPEGHKLYALGNNYFKEYSYQLSGSDDDYITPISKPIMINYPNPFNPSTTISFTLKEKGHKNKIAIYNLKGEKVKELIPTNCKIGKNTITWNGTNENGKKVASGVYLYSLIQDGKAIVTKKMVMVK